MVLDVKDEIPKLIGSSLISLAKVMEKIKLDVEKHGIGNPSAYETDIGVISLSYKIVSLGALLIPQMPENRVYVVGVTLGKGGRDLSVHARCPEKDEMPPEVHENHSGNVLLQQITQSADIVTSEAKQPGVPAFSQTETTEKRQRISWSDDAQEYTTFCPPALVYSSGVKNPQERKSRMLIMNKTLIKNLLTQLKETPLRDVIRQLPLLNALVVELSQLNIQTAQQQPLLVHPNLVCLYTSAQEPSEAKPKAENQKNKSSTESATGAKRKKEKLQPKKTLKYGLTNTFRLRLKLIKQGTKQHECIKYQNAKRHQPSSSNHKRVRKAVSRGVQYQDDFTSLNTTEGYSPDPLRSPEPSRRERNSSPSSSSSSHPSKGLPVPLKAENSPQRAFKSTHIIRPRLQTSALSLSSDEDESRIYEEESRRHRPGSQSTGLKTPSVRRTFGKSESFDSDPGDKGMTFSRVSEDSDSAPDNPVLKSTSSSEHDEERDELGSLGLDKNYHHISELAINKLPGYTL
uniref:Microtubule-associated protein 10 C-terminal domain-containing protein n=1 Tax=Cyprinus carpio carpio TaxID=630221 RepID=A0A8C1E6R5_CYPCA